MGFSCFIVFLIRDTIFSAKILRFGGIYLIKLIDISRMKEFEVEGNRVLLVNSNGKYFVVGSRCPYGGEPLIDGQQPTFHIAKFL